VSESELPLTVNGAMKLSVFPVSVLKEVEKVPFKLDADIPFNWLFAVAKNIAKKTGTEPMGFAEYDRLALKGNVKNLPLIDAEKFEQLETKQKEQKPKPKIQEFKHGASYDKWGTKRPETVEEMEAVRLETIAKLEDMKAAGTLNVFQQILLENFVSNDPDSPANPLNPTGPTKAQVAMTMQ
jgi:predicted DNA-binding protein (UPF0251 family)